MNKHTKKTLRGKALRGIELPLLGALALVFAVMISACNLFGGSDKDDDKWYEGTGLENGTGTLTIKNISSSPVLVFYGEVDENHFAGKIGGLGSIKVKLPSESPYSLIAIDKSAYESRGAKAEQTSYFVFYSASVAYEISVTASGSFGQNEWVINNYSNYWVALRNVNGSGENFATVPPNVQNVKVYKPDGTYYFRPRYFKEIKVNNQTLGLAESENNDEANIVQFDSSNRTFTTDLGGAAGLQPSTDLNPMVRVTNNSDKSVTVHQAEKKLLPESAEDFALMSGKTYTFTGGGNPFEAIAAGTHTTSLNFRTIAWGTDYKYVTQDFEMKKNYIYEVVFSGTAAGGYYSTVTEKSIAEVEQASLMAPSILLSSVSSTSVTLGWNSVTGATSYKVYRNGTLKTSQTTTTYTDSGLSAGTTYTYKVSALNGSEEKFSVELPVTTSSAPAEEPLAAPTPSQQSVTENNVGLVWDVVSGATGYNVYRGTTKLTSSPITRTFYSDSGLTASTTYTYYVESVRGSETVKSSGLWVTTSSAPAEEPLTAPTPAQQYVTTSMVGLVWNVVSGATGYNVYRGTTKLTDSPITRTFYSDSGLTASTTYTYYVESVRGSETAKSSGLSVTTAASATDASMTLAATAAADKFQIDLTWSFNLPVTSYTVKRGSSSTSFDTTLTTSAAGTSTFYSDKGLSAGQTYYYLVEAEVSSNLYYRKVSQAVTTPTDIILTPSAVYSEFDIKAGNIQWFKVSGTYYNYLLNYNMNTVSSFSVYDYQGSHSGSSHYCSNPDRYSSYYSSYEWSFSSGSTGTKQVGCSSSYDYYIKVSASSDGIYKLRLLDN